MRLFGSLTELVSIIYRKNSQQITVRPNQATTYTASRDVQLPPGDAAHVLTSADSTQTVTNKSISGSTNTVTNISLTTAVTGTLPIGNGGTGQVTANAALNGFLPTQTGNSGKALTTDGSNTSWTSVASNPMTTLGDTIYGGSAGASTRLAGNITSARQVLTQTGTGSVSAAPSWGDIYNTANIRGSEGAGTTTLTSSDLRTQVFNLSASRTVVLPTTGILAGEVWVLKSSGAGDLVVQASNTTQITFANAGTGSVGDPTIRSGTVILVPLQNTPTTPAHWSVISVVEMGSFSGTITSGLSGTPAYSINYTRVGQAVTMFWNSNTGTTSGSSVTSSANNFTRLIPSVQKLMSSAWVEAGGNIAVIIRAETDGTFTLVRYDSNNFAVGTSSIRSNFCYYVA